jgi:hypothetical protein
MGFGGLQQGSGRPKAPRASEVLRERVETQIDRWLAPFEDALGAVNPAGGPDHRARMEAARAVLDRVYGKPASAATSNRGSDRHVHGEPIDEAIDAEIERLMNDLRRQGDPG